MLVGKTEFQPRFLRFYASTLSNYLSFPQADANCGQQKRSMLSVMVTGPSGFIGSRILALRTEAVANSESEWFPWSTSSNTELPSQQVDAVVHCAGLAHQMTAVDPKLYFEINHTKTIQLARQLQERGTKHFLFLSSTKVFGDSHGECVFDEATPCKPTDAYGESKLKAEVDLMAMASPSFQVSIIRPPLVFGPKVKGNFIRLIKLADSALPLPFGNAKSRRSMVFVDNLVAMIRHLIVAPVTGIFHAGEASAPTVQRLVELLRTCLQRPRRLVAVPDFAINLSRRFAPSLVSRLFDGFMVRNEWTNQRLGFEPPYSLDTGIRTTVDWYLQSTKKAA